MQAHAQQRRGFLQCIRGSCLEIVSQRDDFSGFFLSGDLAGPELGFGDAFGGQPAQYQHFFLENVVLCDFKAPGRIKGIVEAGYDGRGFDVGQGFVEIALSVFDLIRGKGAFELFSVHGYLLEINLACPWVQGFGIWKKAVGVLAGGVVVLLSYNKGMRDFLKMDG
jgi:hypothetical protein